MALGVSPELLAIPCGLVIGLIVGTVGGGGAILALPVLVYLLGESVGPASTASLIVVAIAAGIGAGVLAFRGEICWRLAFTFFVPAALGTLAGTYANGEVSPKLLVLAFVPVMIVAAGATWQRAGATHDSSLTDCPAPGLSRVVPLAAGVGVLTGFFGVGGGFLIVPALTLRLDVGFRRAVATSLVIITLTGSIALTSHLIAGTRIDVPVTASLAGATALGAVAGTMVGKRLPEAALGRAFASVVFSIAVFMLVDTLLLGGPPGT